MSKQKRVKVSTMAAAAIPVGIAAVFAFQGTASAASSADAHLATAMVRVAALRSTVVDQVSTRHKDFRPKLARIRAYYWALSQKGHPYQYGGTGPGYDCSGLVMMAYRHAGIHLPRTTYEMLASPLLVRVTQPRIGDLAFYGSGHVELFRRWGYTFGAHDYGSPVSLIHYGWGWRPTAFYRVRVPHRRRRR